MRLEISQGKITVQNDQNQVAAELTYFRLPSHKWLLEQIFADSPKDLKSYSKILIKTFFVQVPQSKDCVRVLDPFARSYLQRHSVYQNYIYKV